MNRDNLLYTTIGVLAGFISGYFVHEVVALHQPPPLALLQAAQAQAAAAQGGFGGGMGEAQASGAGGGQPASGQMPGGPGGAPMAEIQKLKDQIEKNPNDAEAILTLANLNYDIRNWERARELYTRYLELKPAHPDILTDLGITLRGLGRFQEAMARFEEAQKLQAGHWQSLYNEVVVLAFDLNDLAGARSVLTRLKELQPDNPEVQRLAAEVDKRGGAA